MSGLRQKGRRSGFTLNRLIPNAVTLLALCAGMTAIRFALLERWEIAVGAVVVAMILDALDGSIARLMRATSEFGAQLDSLCDVINFGVAPALIAYLWTLQDLRGFGWAVCLLFAICCALRLARFNTGLSEEDPPIWTKTYFTGVPAPSGAGLALLPMMLSFNLGDEVFRSPMLVAVTMLVVAFLMVSRIPTYSSKRIKIERRQAGWFLLSVGALGAFLVSTPWITLSVLGVLYLVSIPVSAWTFKKIIKNKSD